VDSAEPVLTTETVRELARPVLTIQGHFGGVPQDIEWLTAAGVVYVVQSRPYPTGGRRKS